MRTLSLISLFLVVVACGTPTARTCSVDSDCSSDALCSGGFCQGVLIVTMRAPSTVDPVYTNGSVDFEIEVSGGFPDKLELIDGSTVFAELKTTLTYSWDTRSLAEGPHTVFARATIGQNSYASAPATIVVDRTRPTVLTLGPTPGNTDVNLDDPIQVTFSEPISAASLSEGAVLLVSGTDSQALSRTLTLSADGKTLTISPVTSLAAPCTLTATLTSLITDLAGNSLVPPEDLWTWSMPRKCVEDSACPSDAICISGGCRDVFADRSRIVFVSTSSSSTADGTHTHPLATIQAGLDKAATLGSGARVYVETGTYQESVSLRSEVSIFGGYGDGWRRETKQFPTTIAGGTRTVSGSQVFNIELDGLSIVSADATAEGESSYGVILSQSQSITVSDCDIVAGDGAAGSPGTSGTDGSNGYKGRNSARRTPLSVSPAPVTDATSRPSSGHRIAAALTEPLLRTGTPVSSEPGRRETGAQAPRSRPRRRPFLLLAGVGLAGVAALAAAAYFFADRSLIQKLLHLPEPVPLASPEPAPTAAPIPPVPDSPPTPTPAPPAATAAPPTLPMAAEPELRPTPPATASPTPANLQPENRRRRLRRTWQRRRPAPHRPRLPAIGARPS